MNRRAILSGAVTWAAVIVSGTAKAAGGITVYKDPNCGCCHAWADALAKAGFSVAFEDVTDLPARSRRGITCRTPGELPYRRR